MCKKLHQNNFEKCLKCIGQLPGINQAIAPHLKFLENFQKLQKVFYLLGSTSYNHFSSLKFSAGCGPGNILKKNMLGFIKKYSHKLVRKKVIK